MAFLYLFVEVMAIEVNVSNLIASLIATYVAYLLNARYIFTRGKFDPKRELYLFFLYSFFGLMLNVLLMYLLTTFVPISIYISKTLVTLWVAIFNFVTRKYLVFNG